MTEETPMPEGLDAIWLPISTAPKDGKAINLLIASAGREHALRDTNDPTETVGFWFEGDEGGGKWQFAGWDWCNDIFVDGEGEPIMWAPIPLASATADLERELAGIDAVLARRPAIAHLTTRSEKVELAVSTAARATNELVDLERRLAEWRAMAKARFPEVDEPVTVTQFKISLAKAQRETFDLHASLTPSLAALTERNAALEAALTGIVGQKLSVEMTEEEYDGADFEGAYDIIINVARAALSPPSQRSSREVQT